MLRWIGFPIRLAVWVGALLIFWPVCAFAILCFAPDWLNMKRWTTAQADSFREFVLLEVSCSS